MRKLLPVLLVLFCALGAAQQKADKVPPAAPALVAPVVQLPPAPPLALQFPAGVTDTLTAYLLSDDMKLKIRDGQLEYSELEGDSQKMLLKVEQNKARQKEITETIRTLAYQFALSKQIDLKVWEIDAKELKFVKKKPAAK